MYFNNKIFTKSGKCIFTAKETSLKYRIEIVCFTYKSIIDGKIYITHPKNMNYVHKYGKELLSVIIKLGTNVSGGDTVFYHGVLYSDMGKRSRFLKHLHARCVVGPFERYFHEASLWGGNRSVISFIIHKSIMINFFHRGGIFYNAYIKSDIRTIYIYDYRTGVKKNIYIYIYIYTE